MDPVTATAVLAATAVASTGASMYSQSKAADAQKDAMKAQSRQEALKAARAKRDAIREARMAQATVLNNAEAAGASGSSSVAGGVGSIQSQLHSNLSFMGQMSQLSQQINAANMDALTWQNRSNMFSGAADLAATGAGATSGHKTWGDVFGKS